MASKAAWRGQSRQACGPKVTIGSRVIVEGSLPTGQPVWAGACGQNKAQEEESVTRRKQKPVPTDKTQSGASTEGSPSQRPPQSVAPKPSLLLPLVLLLQPWRRGRQVTTWKEEWKRWKDTDRTLSSPPLSHCMCPSSSPPWAQGEGFKSVERVIVWY